MKHSFSDGAQPKLLTRAPDELTYGRLRRLGEGIGKVVYASDHWVVKRERSGSEIAALIFIWKLLRKFAHRLPGGMGEGLLARPSRRIRFLRVLFQAVVRVVPRSLWYTTHVGEVWHLYLSRDARGRRLAQEHLVGTSLVPECVEFPPTRVKVNGWPGWLTVAEATERVEATLLQRLLQLAKEERFDEVEQWLDRFLELRQEGWRRGLFSVDAHLKNFGVTGDRIVLLDPGGLTDNWTEVEERLSFEEVVAEPHIQLGLGALLGARPDIAARFNSRWKKTVSRAGVRQHWPSHRLPQPGC
jgi:hypothetical protein